MCGMTFMLHEEFEHYVENNGNGIFFENTTEPQTGIPYRVTFVLQCVGQVRVVANRREDLGHARARKQRGADTGERAHEAGTTKAG